MCSRVSEVSPFPRVFRQDLRIADCEERKHKFFRYGAILMFQSRH